VITTAANELVDQIHDRTPLILAHEDYARRLAYLHPGNNFPSCNLALRFS